MRTTSAVLSRARKTGGIPRAAIKHVSHAADNSAAESFPPRHGGGHQAANLASRRALKNWRVRSRLLLLVIIPTVTALAAGGIFIASSVQSAFVFQRVLTLANMSGKVTGLVQALQSEREDTVQFIVLGSGNGGRGASPTSATPPTPELGKLSQDYAVTAGWADQVKALASEIDGSYPVLAQQDTQAALTAIGNLSAIRAASTGTRLPASIVIEEYATAINTLLTVESQIAVGSSDSTLAGTVRVLGLVSSMKEQASQQQALLTSALRSDLVSLGQFGPTLQSALTDALAQQQGDLNEFDTAATVDQRQSFNSVLSSAAVVRAQAQEQQAISLASSGVATDPTISDASSALSYVVSGMRSVEQQFADSVTARSGSLRGSAITSAIVFSLAVALLLGVALIATTVVGRSMVRPLSRLRNGALKIAETRLPDIVRRMNETDGEGVPLEVEPIDVDSSDEIGEVARAFDQVHREAVRLAANEAALRGNVNAMFVNLSRRSQSLVERQIHAITKLERGEQDSKRLASLFQIDHLATRMRRNSENLLVLAGHELSRRWSRPVALVDVLRAAVSEIERYERVTLNVQPGISVRKEAVSDVVHLTAELVENATTFSAADTPVTIAAHLLGSGGALVEITDKGLGMPAEHMVAANWRLDNPPVVDVAVSRRMGLFVVARLAARHGIRVRLQPGPSGGVSALVWLPDEAITRGKSGTGPLRSVSTGSKSWAFTSTTDTSPAGVEETGRVISLRETSQDLDRDLDQDLTGPLPRLRAGLDARSRPREPEPGHIDNDLRNEAFSATADVSGLSGAEIGQRRRANGGSADRERGTSPGEVVVPPPHAMVDDERLPIFEAVESSWFHRGKQVMGRADQGVKGWSSPADDGWRAARMVQAPASDGTTTAGLPKRVPKANFVPGTAATVASESGPAGGTSPRSAPARSAAEARDRFASYQRGIRQGRAASTGEKSESGEDSTP
jgi:signal transduction histidine kinase